MRYCWLLMARTFKLKRLAENGELSGIVARTRTAIWTLRDREKVTQAAAAERLGISVRTMSRHEASGDMPSVATLSKLVDWASTSGYSDVEADFRSILTTCLHEHFGSSEASLDEGCRVRLQTLLRSFQDLWEVFCPVMNETEQRIYNRLGELVGEIAKEISH